MCSFGGVAMGGQAGGSLLSAIGKLTEGQQQSSAYEYQSEVADSNAQISRMQMVQASQQGRIADQALQERGAEVFGAGRASAAGNGVMLGTGSEADWEADTKSQIATDRELNKYNTNLKIWGYENQANQYDAQSSMYDVASSNATTNSYFNFAGSLLSGTGSTIMGGYQLDKAGAFDGNWFSKSK